MSYQSSRLRMIPGDGEVHCPKKGLIAIQRCAQLQVQTKAEGAACTCDIYRNYRGRIPQRMADEDAAGGQQEASSPRRSSKPRQRRS